MWVSICLYPFSSISAFVWKNWQIPWRWNWNTEQRMQRHVKKSTWKPLLVESKFVYSSTSLKWPQEQPVERNRQLQRKLCWCPLLRLQCPSWSEMEMIGLICFQRPQSWLVELRNFATRSFMRSWQPCLWGANSTMPKLIPDPSLSAFQCTPTTQVSWSAPSVCDVRPQC